MGELLLLWGELVECRYGDNKFGGDTAELYAYRFGRHEPRLQHVTSLDDPWMVETGLERAGALHALLDRFQAAYEVDIEVDGRPFGDWVRQTPFVHRAHVRVRPKR